MANNEVTAYMTDSESIVALAKIFHRKNWFAIDDDEQYIFETFCNLLQVLEPDERALIIELVNRFYWIAGNMYERDIKDAIKLVPYSEFASFKEAFLFPIVKPTDDKKTKSGHGLTYDVKAMMPTLSNVRHISAKIIEEFEEFDLAPSSKSTQQLWLIDDFIGTGDTLNQCLDEIAKRMSIDFDRTYIFCISCQKETYDCLVAKGVKIFSKYLVERGISDFYLASEIGIKKDLMRVIEKSIPGSSSFSLGFQESEALITLKRTPDNTFPVFWMKMRKGGKYFNPPFLRDK